jgi:hypothetical protein
MAEEHRRRGARGGHDAEEHEGQQFRLSRHAAIIPH